MDEPFALPRLNGALSSEGVIEETLCYRVRPRPQPKFHTVLNTKRLFGGEDGEAVVKTSVIPGAAEGAAAVHLDIRQRIGNLEVHDRFTSIKSGQGARAGRLERRIGEARREDVDFTAGPFEFPAATYPEVLLPFLMRGQRFEVGHKRAAYSWSCDRFAARVYYESRGEQVIEVPAGQIKAHHVWMYPDLNDWVSLGSVITRLAKPLLPRYDLWFESDEPGRPVKYEGPYGPPGAPEVILELMR